MYPLDRPTTLYTLLYLFVPPLMLLLVEGGICIIALQQELD